MSGKYTFRIVGDGAYVVDPDGNDVGARMSNNGVVWTSQVQMAQDAYERGKRDAAAPVAATAGHDWRVGDVFTFTSRSDGQEFEITHMDGNCYEIVWLNDGDKPRKSTGRSLSADRSNMVKVRSAPVLASANVTNPGWTA